jgi:selenide,water dikinase
MGGIPKTAMNLVAFPINCMDISILRQILEGGIVKMREAGVVLVGGHSIEDKELKYGLSVTGFIHPDRVLTKKNLKIGDRLILTKPLGTGIINTAIKGDFASSDMIEYVTRLMATLNRDAAEAMSAYPVHACTDITGFGLLGHLAEMVIGSGMGIRLIANQIPIIPEAIEYAKIGLVPGGAYKNREFRQLMVEFADNIDIYTQDVLFDPQTSGGLLICVEKDSAVSLLNHLKQKRITDAAVIGEVISEPKEKIVVMA